MSVSRKTTGKRKCNLREFLNGSAEEKRKRLEICRPRSLSFNSATFFSPRCFSGTFNDSSLACSFLSRLAALRADKVGERSCDFSLEISLVGARADSERSCPQRQRSHSICVVESRDYVRTEARRGGGRSALTGRANETQTPRTMNKCKRFTLTSWREKNCWKIGRRALLQLFNYLLNGINE